jgi:hypothetical protein
VQTLVNSSLYINHFINNSNVRYSNARTEIRFGETGTAPKTGLNLPTYKNAFYKNGLSLNQVRGFIIPCHLSLKKISSHWQLAHTTGARQRLWILNRHWISQTKQTILLYCLSVD